MNTSGPPPTPVVLASFFHRLEDVEAITRVMLSNAKISALLTLRGETEKKVLLDFTKYPALIRSDDHIRSGTIYVTVAGDVMHEVLLDRLPAGVALGRREMLLRGSASNLAKFIPLFDFGPLLYREHLTDMGIYGFSRQPEKNLPKEITMNTPQFKGDPIPLVQLSTFEKVLFGIINSLSYGLGYLFGLLRYRVLKKMNLFSVLSAMSQGLAAATPKEILGVENPDN